MPKAYIVYELKEKKKHTHTNLSVNKLCYLYKKDDYILSFECGVNGVDIQKI